MNMTKEFTPLSKEDITRIAPSVFQEKDAPTLSERYRHITTVDMIDGLKEQNWYPVQAQEVRARKNHTKGYQKHLIQFENPELNVDKAVAEVGDQINPRIVLTNSHDGKNAFSFHFGIFRLVCSNGLVVPSAEFSKFRVLHKGDININEIEEGVAEYVANVSPVLGQINDFKNINLTKKQKRAFAKKALEIRYGSYDDSPIGIDEIVKPYREEDKTDDLWTVFNILQENISSPEKHDIHAEHGQKKRFRGLKAIDSYLDFNQNLWLAMAQYASVVK